MDKTFLNCCLN